MVSCFGTQEAYQDLKLLHPNLKLSKETLDTMSSQLLQGIEKTGKRVLDIEGEPTKIQRLIHTLVIYLLLNKKIDDYFMCSEENEHRRIHRRIYINRNALALTAGFNFPSMRLDLLNRIAEGNASLTVQELYKAAYNTIKKRFGCELSYKEFIDAAETRMKGYYDLMQTTYKDSVHSICFPHTVIKELNLHFFLILTNQIEGFLFSELSNKKYIYFSLRDVKIKNRKFILTKNKLLAILRESANINFNNTEEFKNTEEIVKRLNIYHEVNIPQEEFEHIGKRILIYLMLPFFSGEMNLPSELKNQSAFADFLVLTGKIGSYKYCQSTNRMRVFLNRESWHFYPYYFNKEHLELVLSGIAIEDQARGNYTIRE